MISRSLDLGVLVVLGRALAEQAGELGDGVPVGDRAEEHLGLAEGEQFAGGGLAVVAVDLRD